MGKHARVALALTAILILALVLRLWGIDFGLPYQYHIDEHNFVWTALRLGQGVLNTPPYDPTGFSNLLFADFGLLYGVGRVLGVFQSAQDLKLLYWNDPTVFYLLSRLTSAFLGGATVLVLFFLGRRIKSGLVGLLSAFILATSFLHVRDSHYGTQDITMCFFVSLCVLLCLEALAKRRTGYYVLAGVAGGLAFATKWTALPVFLPVVLTGFIGGSSIKAGFAMRARLSKLLIGSLAFGIGAALGSLQIVLNPVPYWGKAFSHYMTAESAKAAGFLGLFEVDTALGWIFYGKTLLYVLGVGVFVLGMAGLMRHLVSLFRDRDKMSTVLLSFPLLYYTAMGSTHYYFYRYTLPVIPFMALFAAEAIEAVWTWLGTRQTRMGWSLTAVLVVSAITQPLAYSVQHNMLLTRQDTRSEAKLWIETHVPEGSKIAVDWQVHTPPLSTPKRAMPYSDKVYDVTIVGWAGLSEHPVSWYREQGFDYLIATSFIYNIPLTDKILDANRRAFYASLAQELTLVAKFEPSGDRGELPFVFDEMYGPLIGLWQRERPGPTLKIYQVGR